jgi:hypothetical protein
MCSESVSLFGYISRYDSCGNISGELDMFIEIFTENALLIFLTAETTPVIIFLFILFLIGTLVPVLLVGLTIVNWWQNKQLLTYGEPAHARILKIWDTGVTLNDDPQVGMLLEVHAKDRPVFQGEAKSFVSRLSIPLVQVGSSVQVRFDPQNPSRIAIVL